MEKGDKFHPNKSDQSRLMTTVRRYTMPPDHHPHDDPKREQSHDGPPEIHDSDPAKTGSRPEPEPKPSPSKEELHPPHDATACHSQDAVDKYLFTVAYEDDAERKRAEYLFNTWEDGEIRKPEGLVRIVEDVDQADLYTELLMKFRPTQINAYALSALEIPETPETRSLERTIAADPATVRSFLQYLISKKKGTETSENEYAVYTNKGRADISVSLTGSTEETTATIDIEGHPPILDFLGSYFETELNAFESGL